jgi:signal transduction histidine kinase
MSSVRLTGSTIRERGWFMLALLIGSVLVLTGCILWFMNEAVESQNLAARQTVLEAYRNQLRFIRKQIDTAWETRMSDLDRLVPQGTPEETARAIASGVADALILLDEQGSVTYPRVSGPFRPANNAERLAAEFLALDVPRPQETIGLQPTRVPEVWQLVSASGRVIALYRDTSVHMAMHGLVDPHSSEAIRFTVFQPGESGYDETLALGSMLQGWQVSFELLDMAVLERPDRTRITAYLWVGLLGIGLFTLMAIGIGHSFNRQLRLTRLKTDLVAAVSHELRTPLASMRLLVDALLRDKELEPRKTREYLDLIAVENGRLSRLIDNFLTFSRLERNRHQFSFETIRPAEVVEAAVVAMRERLHPGCVVDVDIAPGLPSLVADADGLVTALLNLLDNAYKYTPAEKRIALRAFHDKGHVVFTVQDNGIGIPAGEQKRIFRRFYRVDRRLSRETSGVGLGLSIVHEIVKAHGGTVHVTSHAGEGSTFTLRVPIAVAVAGARA